jgi:hypothetical protein
MKLCKSCGTPQESSGVCKDCAVSSRKCQCCSTPCKLKWCFKCYTEYQADKNRDVRFSVTTCYESGEKTCREKYCKTCYKASKCKTCENQCDPAYKECKTCFEKHPICGCGKRILHDKGGNFCTPCFKKRPSCKCGRKILHDKEGALCTPCFKASQRKPTCYTQGCLGRGAHGVEEGNQQVTVCTGCFNEYYA